MDSGEPTLVPQWLRGSAANGSSSSGQQTRGEGVWLRPRVDSSLGENTGGKSNPRHEFSGRGGFSGNGEGGPTPRRPSDRSFRGQRYGFREPRVGSFSARGDPFDDREPPIAGAASGPYSARNEGRALTRSLSEGFERSAQILGQGSQGGGGGRAAGHHRSTTATDFGREGGFSHTGLHNRSVSGCRADGAEVDLGFERIANQRHHSAQTSARQRTETTSASCDSFERDFPSLSIADHRSGSPADKAPSWLPQSASSHAQWTSRLAEVPPSGQRQEVNGDVRPLSGSQSARMADAVQQSVPEMAQQVVTDKQRLEVKQSRMMIPVVPPQTKSKNGSKASGTRRNDRDRDVKLYNSMMSASMKPDDAQKDGTVVLGRRTGVLPKMTISWGEAPPAVNGVMQEVQLGDTGFAEMNGHYQKSLSGGRKDYAAIQERQRMQERERNRNSFFDMLKKKSAVSTGQPHCPSVKRAVSAPPCRMKALVASSVQHSVLQGPSEGEVHQRASGLDLNEGTPAVGLQVDAGEIAVTEDSQLGNSVSTEHGIQSPNYCSPKGEGRLEEQNDNSDDTCPCAPPSPEEERLLREMGWHSDQGNDEDFCLTEEEIAAFKAQQYKRHQPRSPVLSPIQFSFRMSPAKLYASSGFLVASHGSELTTSDSESDL